MPKVLGEYGNPDVKCGINALVRIVRADDGHIVFEHCVTVDAMGARAWIECSPDRGGDLIVRAATDHAEIVAANCELSGVAIELLELIRTIRGVAEKRR